MAMAVASLDVSQWVLQRTEVVHGSLLGLSV